MTPKSPVISSIQLLKALRKDGFEIIRQRGSHMFLLHPDGRHTTVPRHKKDLGKGLLKEILRQSDLTVEELLELLK